MATPSALHRWTALRALTFLTMLAVLVQGRNRRGDAACPRFSCGPLRNVSFPFRRAGDPAGCGDKSGELACTDAKATLRIADATYYVTSINYTDSTFQIIDTDLDLHSSCPRLPRWNRRPHEYLDGTEEQFRPFDYDDVGADLALVTYSLASFVECSQEVRNNGMYMPVACMSNSGSFVYVLTGPGASRVENLEPWCRYLAMTPLGGPENRLDIRATALENASYTDVVKSMRTGFAVRFTPFTSFKDCLLRLIRTFREEPMQRASIILNPDLYIIECGIEAAPSPYVRVCLMLALFVTRIFKWINGPYRFLWGYLAVWTFFAYKYWKTRITIDAVEKFLRVQQMLTPTRYAYTDITAVTGHFRDKLGQGGYGSVFKGVLLNDFHVAVKMLAGNSNCNGEDFISEVSTIGRIHHVNVVRLVGFCSEETRRALIYEYMPRGSLDKYIFSAKKSFSWDKLIDIALGIARGINYLHQGCEMQILHFDIKPHNILLDSNFVPKVADFGLAKLYPRDNSFVPSRALRGTIGYIAPEMISRSFGAISNKSDVYSFGMLLLEMAGGRRNADPDAANSSQAYYPSWVYDRLIQREHVGEISTHVDTEMHELEKKLCIIGLWCIQMKSHDRPMMSEVIEMLEGNADSLQMPSRPFFCDEGHIHTEDTYHISSELTEISEEDMSENIDV
ncbi:hypothetical protein ACQJBY_025059 [Aegilops geniculata]